MGPGQAGGAIGSVGMRFTDKGIQALRRRAKRYEVVEDGSGLCVRVSSDGIKSFSYRYRFAGKAQRMTLGVYRDRGVVDRGPAASHDMRGVAYLTLADARVKLAEAKKLRDSGVNPAPAATKQHEAERKADTVAELIDEYLKRHANAAKAASSAAEDARMLNKDVRPAWGDRKAKGITKRDVIQLLDGIVERDAPVAANRTLAVVRKMFNWAIDRDILVTNPCSRVKAPGKEHERERVLKDGEVRSLWERLPPVSAETLVIAAERLMKVLNRPRRAVAGAEWSEFDPRGAVWRLPAERSSDGKKHEIRLQPKALEALEQIRNRTGNQRWLFPAEGHDEPMVLMAPRLAAAARLLLVTAQRRSEVAEAPWAEFDEDQALWTISGERTKNGLVHLVPLSPLALSLLREIREAFGKGKWLFPSTRGDGPITAAAVTQAFRDNLAGLHLEDATVHDLRRTAGTRMSEMGVTRFVVKRVLNHTERDVTDIYDRYQFLAEKRHALETWAARVERIVAGEPGGNVVQIRRNAG